MSDKRPEETRARAPSIPDVVSTETASFLLRSAAWCSVLASMLGVVIAPGVRGNASQTVVESWDRVSTLFAYAMFALLVIVVVIGALDLARMLKIDRGSRSVAIGGAVAVVGFSAAALLHRLVPPAAVLMAIAASLIATTGAWYGLRAPHTRAVSVVLAAFAIGALVRVCAWELAASAGERASPSLYGVSRGMATAAVIFEGLGQIAASMWLSMRTRISGRIFANLAIVGALLVTWGAAQGVHAGAPMWQSALHTALADASGVPPPYGLNAVATFLTAAGILLALAALLQRGSPAPIVCALALALIARGSFDVPLRALSITAAALWTTLTMLDPRALWASLKSETPKKELNGVVRASLSGNVRASESLRPPSSAASAKLGTPKSESSKAESPKADRAKSDRASSDVSKIDVPIAAFPDATSSSAATSATESSVTESSATEASGKAASGTDASKGESPHAESPSAAAKGATPKPPVA